MEALNDDSTHCVAAFEARLYIYIYIYIWSYLCVLPVSQRHKQFIRLKSISKNHYPELSHSAFPKFPLIFIQYFCPKATSFSIGQHVSKRNRHEIYPLPLLPLIARGSRIHRSFLPHDSLPCRSTVQEEDLVFHPIYHRWFL
jgi:hypothetical protein